MALILAVAIAIGALFSNLLMLRSIDRGLNLEMSRLGADLLVVPVGYEAKASSVLLGGEAQSFYMDRDVERKVASVEGVIKASPQVFMETSAYLMCCDIMETLLVGFNPEKDFTIRPWIESRLNEPIDYEHDVITGGGVPVYEGFTYYIYGKEFRVYARLQKTGLRFFDSTIFIPMNTAYKLAQETKTKEGIARLELNSDQISVVLLKLEPEANSTKIAEQIEREIPRVKVMQIKEMFAAARQQFLQLFGGLMALACVIWVANTLMISAIFTSIVSERQRELGLLRAIGAQKGSVFRLIILEALILTAIGGVIGIGGGGAIFALFKNHITSSFTVLKIPYIWPSVAEMAAISLLSFLSSIGMGILGAVYPAIISSKMEPYLAIRTGE